MKNMRLTALCLSAAITLSTITAPVLASDDVNKASIQVKGNITVSLDKPDKSKNPKLNPSKLNFKFSDSKDYIESMAWAMKAIEKLGAKGIISGYADKSYKPQDKVKNIEALTLILKLTGNEEESKKNDRIHSTLAQYEKQWGLKWGWGYLFVAIDKGILLPEEIKGFNPNQPIKRHELAKYLIRAIGKTKDALDNMDSDLDFKDANAIPKDSRGYVYMVNKLGIMTGVGNGQFKPNEPLTRAEIAVLIDKADSYLNGDYDDEYEDKVVFVSYENNKLTVKDNSDLKVYRTIEDVIVYKDKSYTNVNDLDKGDVLEVVLNSSKQVIFIEVIGYVEDDEDEDENRKNIEFTKITAINKLPDEIQDDLSTLRATKGYKAYEFDNEIYLATFMGKKNTGGYSIEIDAIESYKLSNGKYIVKAFVNETEPSSRSMVTQAITYPYTVVKFDSFDNIERINFIDEAGNVLAKKSIVDLDEEETTAAGVLTAIGKDYSYIEVLKDKISKEYVIADDVKVYINNKTAELKDLKVYMNVKLTLADEEVIRIYANYEIKEIKGTVQSISTTKNQIRINNTTYNILEDTEITLDDNEAKLSDLETGMKAAIELYNGKVTNIDAENVEESYSGGIRAIEKDDDEVESITLLVNGVRKVFKITEETYFDMIDDSVPTDLDTKSEVEINLLNGKVIEVIELD